MDRPMSGAPKPEKTPDSFLRHVIANTTQYTEGWRAMAAEMLELREAVARKDEALKAAQHCIDPNLPHAEDVEAQIAEALKGESRD